ncbi:MAG: hypothetical protein VX768_15550 [Planctomycetota bacterium]|nr:hypothetical protein [Planctomycetota bacterium]
MSGSQSCETARETLQETGFRGNQYPKDDSTMPRLGGTVPITNVPGNCQESDESDERWRGNLKTDPLPSKVLSIRFVLSDSP